MKIETYIDTLVDYGMETGLLRPEDRYVAVNRILEALRRDDYAPSDEEKPRELEEILKGLLDYAVEAGLCEDNITARDLFDTKLMGLLTPMPREVAGTFWEKYRRDPREATDYYYKLSRKRTPGPLLPPSWPPRAAIPSACCARRMRATPGE